MKSVKFIFIVFLLNTFCFSALAENKVNVQTVVNPKEVEVGDLFIVNVEVSSDEMVSVEPPAPPKIEGATFRAQGQSQRTNAGATMNADGEVEFKRTVTLVYTYQYVAAKAGDWAVPSLSLQAGGATQKTPVAQVKIVAKGTGVKKKSFARPNFFDESEDAFSADPFENLQKMEERFNQLIQRQFGGAGVSGFQAVPDFNEQDAFVIVAEVDKTEAYEGEQITASWYLFTRAGVREIDTLKYPDLKGFWKEDIELATLLNFQPAELNGKQYNKALLASYALFPIEDGKAVIDSYRAKVTVVGNFGKGVTSTKNSQTIPILVKPLPEAGRPANFSGAVGEFAIKAQVESNSVVANQPFALRVHVEGRGNAKQFELPNPQLSSSTELYDIKKDSKFFKNGMSYKTFEILLIPRQAGELVIPPIVTSVFNPRTHKYEELKTQEFKLNVLPGSGQQGLQSARLQDGAAAEKTEELHLLTDWTPASGGTSKPSLNLWLSLFAIVFLSLFSWAAYELRWFRKPLGLKERYKIRADRLQKPFAQKHWRALGVEATNLSAYVLGEISGQGGANLQTEKLLEKAPPSVRRQVGAEIQKLVDKFYLLGFGPEETLQQVAKEDVIKADLKKLQSVLVEAIDLSSGEEAKSKS